MIRLVDVFWPADFVKPNMTVGKMLPVHDMHNVTIYDCFSPSVQYHYTIGKWIDRHIFER